MKWLFRLFKCIPLRAVLLDIHLVLKAAFIWFASAIIVSEECIPKDKFKSTNAALSLWSGPLCRGHSGSSPVQLSVLSKYLQVFMLLSPEHALSALSVLWKVLLQGGRMGDPRKKRNTSSCRRGKSFASFPVLVKSLFPGNDCESCYLQGLK